MITSLGYVKFASRDTLRTGGPTGFRVLTVTAEDNGETLLTGPVVDQAALYGLLRKVRDVAMPLLSVVCVTPGQAEASDVTQEMNDRIKANSEPVRYKSSQKSM